MRLASITLFALVLCGTARADVTMSKDAIVRETEVAKAAVALGAALQGDDRPALDAAARELAAATKAFKTWLAAHPRERTPAIARIVTAAEKLAGAADRLRALDDQHAEPALLQQAAIDGLHRYNELIGAHQGDPPPAEIAMPPALLERFLKMMERIGRDAQQHKPDCDAIAAALMTHVDDDAAVAKDLQDLDDARPQDQREAERANPTARTAARYVAARKLQAPLAACKDNATLAAYRARTNL
jgi:hypothetical protein